MIIAGNAERQENVEKRSDRGKEALTVNRSLSKIDNVAKIILPER